jgi:hypothetical protein
MTHGTTRQNKPDHHFSVIDMDSTEVSQIDSFFQNDWVISKEVVLPK